jgi:hypothetical protein
MTTTEILNEISKLPAREKQTIRRHLDDDLHQENAISPDELHEREFEQTLLAEGVIRTIPSGWNDEDDFEPVEITGKPLSETISEDRGE